MQTASRVVKSIAGGIELFLGIPFIGGAVILSMGWSPLFFMLVLHIVGLVLAFNGAMRKTGHVMGIITSILGFIPVVGMIMHLITACILLFEAGRNS